MPEGGEATLGQAGRDLDLGLDSFSLFSDYY